MTTNKYRSGILKTTKHKNWNERPVGSERTKKDMVQIKVSGGVWKQKQVAVWESVHGKIKKGNVVLFLNGDTRDFCIENLECLTRGELGLLNNILPVKKNREETKIFILIVRIKIRSMAIAKKTGLADKHGRYAVDRKKEYEKSKEKTKEHHRDYYKKIKADPIRWRQFLDKQNKRRRKCKKVN